MSEQKKESKSNSFLSDGELTYRADVARTKLDLEGGVDIMRPIIVGSSEVGKVVITDACDVKLLYPCVDGDVGEKWQMCFKGGSHKEILDDDLNDRVWELKGRAVASVYAAIPKNSMKSLHIKLPVFFLLIKYPAHSFFFEIKILDNNYFHRRFRFSSFHKGVCVDIFSTKIPILLFKGWNIMQINLARLTKSVYRTSFVEAKSVEMHANVRIGRVAFLSRQLFDNEIPRHNSWFSPKRNRPPFASVLMSIYSQQSGQVIDYKNIYEPTF